MRVRAHTRARVRVVFPPVLLNNAESDSVLAEFNPYCGEFNPYCGEFIRIDPYCGEFNPYCGEFNTYCGEFIRIDRIRQERSVMTLNAITRLHRYASISTHVKTRMKRHLRQRSALGIGQSPHHTAQFMSLKRACDWSTVASLVLRSPEIATRVAVTSVAL